MFQSLNVDKTLCRKTLSKEETFKTESWQKIYLYYGENTVS